MSVYFIYQENLKISLWRNSILIKSYFGFDLKQLQTTK